MNRNAHLVLAVVLAAVMVGSASGEILDLNRNRGGFFIGVNFASQGGDMETLGNQLAEEMESEFGGNWTASKGANAGLGVGGYYLIQTSPTFGIEIEGQYIRRGSKIDLTATGMSGFPQGVEAKTEFQINYIEFPVLARFSPSPAAGARVVFLAGPVIGFKTSANLKMTIEDESMTESISDGYQSVNFGLIGGIGLSAQVGNDSYLVVQARYFLGLTNPIDESAFEAKSGDFGFFVGMEFAQ